MSTSTFSEDANVPGTYNDAVSGTKIFTSLVWPELVDEFEDEGEGVEANDFKQSRNLDCAERRDWKDVVRWAISSSSCFFSWVNAAGGRSVSFTIHRVSGLSRTQVVVVSDLVDWPLSSSTGRTRSEKQDVYFYNWYLISMVLKRWSVLQEASSP